MEGPERASFSHRIASGIVAQHKPIIYTFVLVILVSLYQAPQLAKNVKDQADFDPAGPTKDAKREFDAHFSHQSGGETESILITCSGKCTSLIGGAPAPFVHEMVSNLNSTLLQYNRTEAQGWIDNIMTYYDIPSFIEPNPFVDDETKTMLVQWHWKIPEGKSLAAGRIADTIATKFKDNVTTGDTGRFNISVFWGGTLATHKDATEAMYEEPKRAAAALPILLPILACRVKSLTLVIITLTCVIGSILTAASIVSVIALFISVNPMALSAICFFSCALSMDYSLFMLSRYSEQRQAGATWRPAAINMVANSGEAVLVSGMVLFAAGMSGIVLPGGFKGMAMAIASACFSAMVWNLLFTPALIATCPGFFNLCSGWKSKGVLTRQKTAFANEDAVEQALKTSVWYWWTKKITVWPMNIIVVVFVMLLGSPLIIVLFTYVPSISSGLGEPRGASSSVANALIREKFAAGPGCPNPLLVLVKPRPSDSCPATVKSNAYFDATCDLAQRIITETQGKPWEVSSKNVFGAMFHPKFGAVDSSKVVCMPYRHENTFDANPDAYSLLTGDGFFTGDTYMLRKHYKQVWDHVASKDEDATLLIIVPPIDSTLPRGYGLVDNIRQVIKEKVTRQELYKRENLPETSQTSFWGTSSNTPKPFCEIDAYLFSTASAIGDFKVASYARYPYITICTVIPAFVMVGLLFGAYFVPIKLIITVAMPTLWSFGFVVVIYQYGMLDSLGVASLHSNSGMQWSLPIMCFTFLLGLGLDYDLIVFFRIWEFRSDGYCNEDAIRLGVASMGGTIAAAGAIFTLEMAGMLLSPMAQVDELGLLLIASVLIDIIVVETCLVPALLSLRADLNWYPVFMPPPTRFADEDLKHEIEMHADSGYESSKENVPFLLDTDSQSDAESLTPLQTQTRTVPFKKGDRIQVWSNSKRDWLDGVVEEVFETPCYYQTYAIQAGTVKVKWSSGRKFVRFEEIGKELRAADSPSPIEHIPFQKGEKILVWSSSKKDWLNGVVEEVFEKDCRFEKYAIQAGTVKVKSSSGEKFVRSEEINQILRKATCPFQKGDKVKIWSSSQRDWLDGVVQEVFEKSCKFENYAIQAGTVKVKSSSGEKFVRSEDFGKILRLA